MKNYLTILFCILWSIAISQNVLALDIVKIYKPHSKIDQRHLYNNEMLYKAMEKTKVDFGAYKIELTLEGTQRIRSLSELVFGQSINVHIVPTRIEWEEKTIPIRIPVIKGLLGYRLFLIKRQKINEFSNICSLEELKTLKAGLRQQWSTTKAMEALGFNVVTGSSYEGLFHMLIFERFDYFPRGVNEIFSEFNSRAQRLPDMAIEQTKSLYIPQPTYVFVCPKYPELARRIETGLWRMIKDGSFDEIFWKHHGASIQEADLTNRLIFSVENPFLSSKTPFETKDLWFDPYDKNFKIE